MQENRDASKLPQDLQCVPGKFFYFVLQMQLKLDLLEPVTSLNEYLVGRYQVMVYAYYDLISPNAALCSIAINITGRRLL